MCTNDPGPVSGEATPAEPTRCDCGAGLVAMAKFCVECGRPVAPRCEGCGADLPGGAKFCPQCGQGTTASSAPAPTGERRHLTVMFAELADAAVLADRLDPEDMRDVVRAFQQRCTEAVARRGGHIARYMGDSVLIYFGFPHAHPDSAARALAAGLEIVDPSPGVGSRPSVVVAELRVRAGVHAGTVFIGEMGHGERREIDDVVGDTPNIAARLQALARPGELMVSGTVKRIVGAGFEAESLGEFELKGIAEPVSVLRVIRAVDEPPPATRLVGRDAELHLIDHAWTAAVAGEVNVVLVAGEPGVGKSGLIRTALQRSGPHAEVVHLRGEENREHTAFAPIVRVLREELGIASDVPGDLAEAEIAASCVARGLSADDTAPWLCLMADVSPDRYPVPDVSLEARRVRMIEAAANWLATSGLGRDEMPDRTPIAVVVDDLHWCDTSTAEVLDRLRVVLAPRGALLLLTSREPSLPVSMQPPRLTTLPLSRLDRGASTELLLGLPGVEQLNGEEIAAIVRASEGIPLFIEQFARGVADTRSATGRAAIPITLQDSLLARLDRLGEARSVAKAASVLGREFDPEVLRHMAPELRAVDVGLDSLVAAGLLERLDTPSGTRFRFSHSLMEQAAYESQLRDARVRFHRRAVVALEALRPDLVEQEPEVVARHHEQAGDHEPAIAMYEKAARRAASRHAMGESAALVGRALDLLPMLEAGDGRDRTELNLLSLQVAAVNAVHGYANPEGVVAQDRYLAVARRLGDQMSETVALIYIASRYVATGEAEPSRQTCAAMIAGADELGVPYFRLAARSVQAGCLAMTADYPAAIEAGVQGLEALSLVDHPFPAGVVNPAHLCWSSMSLAHWAMGEIDEAIRAADEGVDARFGASAPDPQGLGVGLVYRAWVHLLDDDHALARRDAEAALRIGREQSIAWLVWSAEVYGAIAVCALEPSAEADARLADVVGQYNETSGPSVRYHGYAELALGMYRRGEVGAALAQLELLRADAARLGGAFCEEELIRSQIIIHASEGAFEKASALHREGQELAAARSASGWSLRLAVAAAEFPELADDAKPTVAASLNLLRGSGTTGLERRAALLR